MTTASKTASGGKSTGGRSSSKAARAEAKPKPKKLTWHGLKLELPADPPEEMLFDLIEIEADGDMAAIMRMLRSLLGPEQFMEVRNKVSELRREKPQERGAYVEEITNAVFEKYGMTLGES